MTDSIEVVDRKPIYADPKFWAAILAPIFAGVLSVLNNQSTLQGALQTGVGALVGIVMAFLVPAPKKKDQSAVVAMQVNAGADPAPRV